MYIAFKLKRALAVLAIVGIAAAAVIIGAQYEDSFTAAADSQEGVRLPVIMYHGLLKDPKLQGKYVISPDLFEQDLQYLQANGYTAVGIEDLLKYVDGKDTLPEKPVLLTFDDGYYNNYHYAYPLAKQYKMKIVISPVGAYMDKAEEENDPHPTYSYITWKDMQEMAKSGFVEFQNHTYNLHASKGGRMGTKKVKGESQEDYEALLREDLGTMQKRMEEYLGQEPPCFTYPFGAVSEGEPAIIREMGFRCTLTCESRINVITKDPESLYDLGRYLRPPDLSSESFFQGILKE